MTTSRLLDAAGERFRAALGVAPVDLATGETMYCAGDETDVVYFPATGSMVSLVKTMNDGSRVEVGVCGDEGITGAHVVTGVKKRATDAIVQVGGTMFRASADQLKRAFDDDPFVRAVFLLYLNFHLAQSTVTAACNRLHPIDQRLAKWLLVSRDRLASEDLPLTHEFVSHMLGVRRAGVTTALGELAAAGIVTLGRNRISIVDAEALEKITCECYGEEKDSIEELIEQVEQTAAKQR